MTISFNYHNIGSLSDHIGSTVHFRVVHAAPNGDQTERAVVEGDVLSCRPEGEVQGALSGHRYGGPRLLRPDRDRHIGQRPGKEHDNIS